MQAYKVCFLGGRGEKGGAGGGVKEALNKNFRLLKLIIDFFNISDIFRPIAGKKYMKCQYIEKFACLQKGYDMEGTRKQPL